MHKRTFRKGTKKQYKQFTINTVENACLVLKSLIVPVIIDLEKFKMYSDEAEQILKQYNRKTSIGNTFISDLVSILCGRGCAPGHSMAVGRSENTCS